MEWRVHEKHNEIMHKDGTREVVDAKELLKRLGEGQKLVWQRATGDEKDEALKREIQKKVAKKRKTVSKDATGDEKD